MPAPYQQTVKATDAASSLSNAQTIVANVRSAVTTCQQQYTALQDWVSRDNAYQAAVTLARKQHKPTKGIVQAGPGAAQGRGDVPAFRGVRHRGQCPRPAPQGPRE